MARKRHYYGPKGEYKGWTSDHGPYDWLVKLIMVIVVIALIKSCLGK